MFTPTSEFGRIPETPRNALLAAVSRRVYQNNEVVYLQDDEAEHLYFVVSGHIRLSYLMEDGSAILSAILPVGESFGELGAFEGGAYCDMATAIGASVVAAVPLKILRALGGRHAEINEALARLLARRYRSYITLTRNLSLKTLAGRVAQSLLRLADDLGTRVQYDGRDRQCVGAVVTQADLGLMARGARGNVNRALKAWERAGWIALKDRSIVVIDRDKLENCRSRRTFEMAEAAADAGFGMTDLEEAMRSPGGGAVRDGLIARLDRMAADLASRMKAGLPPGEFARAQAIAKALAAARAIVVAFPVTP